VSRARLAGLAVLGGTLALLLVSLRWLAAAYALGVVARLPAAASLLLALAVGVPVMALGICLLVDGRVARRSA
jgi:hypothetical protein